MHVVTVQCPFCGAEDEIQVDPSGGRAQTYVEDCVICCHPRTVHVQPSGDDDVDVWLERAN